MSELQKATEDFTIAANRLHEAAERVNRALGLLNLQAAEMERLRAIRTAGNPYPHGSKLFVAFEQARSPAFT